MTPRSHHGPGNSSMNRRQALRTGLLTGAGLAAAGAGLLSAQPAASADVRSQGLTWQEGWRWCRKCQGLFYAAPGYVSRCPAGNAHDGNGSHPYAISYSDDPPAANRQSGWRWCRKCQSLAYADFGAGWCPGSGRHDHSGSGNYHLYREVGPIQDGEQDQWRWCRKCQALFYGPYQGSSWCAESNRHDGAGSFNYMIQFPLSASAGSRPAQRQANE